LAAFFSYTTLSAVVHVYSEGVILICYNFNRVTC